jgi:hypothetical protein
MKCPQCEREIARHLTACSECGCQLGFPNVRQAEQASEKVALSGRYDAACAGLQARDCDRVRIEFEQAVRSES